MRCDRIAVVFLVMGLVSSAGWSQDESPKGEQDEPAKAATATQGSDALSSEESAELQKLTDGGKGYKTWSEFMIDWMTAKPYRKHQVVKIDERYAYPHFAAGIKMEIVDEDDEFVWLRGISPEDPNSSLHRVWARREADEARAADWIELSREPGRVNFLNFAAVAVPPPTMESLQFEPSSAKLPNGGRWQMGFAVADMNEDGHSDLVFPPRRKEFPPTPAIFLGDGLGGFRHWLDARWPQEMPWDYGGVTVADLDGDGHQDVIFAIHFKAQFALLGDGKGGFMTGGVLPSPNPRLTSRAVTAADFDGDGRTDLAFVAEIDFDMATKAKIEDAATVWVLFNREDTWETSTAGLPSDIIADVIGSADIDGDGRPELVLSSNSLGPRDLVYAWHGAEGWQSAERRGVLSAAYHYDVEPDDGGVFATFVQFRHYDGRNQARNGIIRYPTSFEGNFEKPEPLVWDAERGNVFFRIAIGDLNGDGRTDFVAGRHAGGLEAYLQTESGDFYLERGSELSDVGRPFDIKLVDLDGDGSDDIIAGCAEQNKKPGGVYVWLTRPTL